jgi:hypothetical protein
LLDIFLNQRLVVDVKIIDETIKVVTPPSAYFESFSVVRIERSWRIRDNDLTVGIYPGCSPIMNVSKMYPLVL